MKCRLNQGQFVVTLLALAIAISAGGCKAEPLPVPPPPNVIVTPKIPDTVVVTTQPATKAPEITNPPTTAVTGITVSSNTAKVSFPDKIKFALQASSSSAVKAITLRYGSDEHTLVPETSTSKPDFKEGKAITATWDWDMKKTGSIPPGVVIWWKWELTDSDGKISEIDRQTLTYTDTRYTWIAGNYPNMNIYWFGNNEKLINELLDVVNTRLVRIQLNVVIPAERKPRVFIYESSEQLRNAVLFEQQWTGALAYPSYNIVLTAVNSTNLDWAKGALPHEITHLMVGEVVFGPFGRIPTWLNEGLAKYSEGDLADYLQQALDSGVKDGKLISLPSLSGSFPADSNQVYLAYGESASVVKYLVEKCGWEKMRSLLQTFKSGSTSDKALQMVYGFDMAGLEKEWKFAIGAK